MAEAGGGGQQMEITNAWARKPGDFLPVGTRFCNWAAPETGDTSEIVFQTVMSYAAFALIIANTIQAMRIADMRYEIAKGYGDLAMDRWNRFASRFKPMEANVVNLLMNDPEIEPDYEEARAVHMECAADPRWETRWSGTASRYGLCPDPSLVRGIRTDERLREDDLVNLGYRDIEDVSHLRDVDRWNRRLKILNTGRDLSSMSLESARQGDEILAKGQQMAGQGIGAAIGFLSYLREMKDTAYSGLGIWMPPQQDAMSVGGMQ